MVAGIRRSGDPVDFHIVSPSEALIVGIEGLEHQDVVPRIAGGHHRKRNGFTAPVGHKDVIQVVLHAPAGIIIPDSLEQLLVPLGFSIGHHFWMIGCYPFKKTIRGGDIRLSDIQMIDFLCLFHPVGNGSQFPDGRSGNVQRPLRNMHVVLLITNLQKSNGR